MSHGSEHTRSSELNAQEDVRFPFPFPAKTTSTRTVAEMLVGSLAFGQLAARLRRRIIDGVAVRSPPLSSRTLFDGHQLYRFHAG